MTDSPKHPAYEKAPHKRRWLGQRLDTLWIRLQEEAKASPATEEQVLEDGGWAWRILSRGAVVALRYRPGLECRFELRIARIDAPSEEGGWKRWDTEVGVFLKHFGIRPMDGETPARHPGRDWYRIREEPRDEGKAAARFIELRPPETRPGKTICCDCGEETGEPHEIEWDGVSSKPEEQRCIRHRIKTRT